jgi:hypothetical protein
MTITQENISEATAGTMLMDLMLRMCSENGKWDGHTAANAVFWLGTCLCGFGMYGELKAAENVLPSFYVQTFADISVFVNC